MTCTRSALAILLLTVLGACSGNGGDFVFINSSPVLAPVGNQLLREGDTTVVDLSATDPDAGDTISFQVTPSLPFASVVDNGDGTGSLSINPSSGDEGTYELIIRATDSATDALFQQEVIRVVIANMNTIPYAGIITDSNTGMPIDGAVVTVRTTDVQAITGADGSYQVFADPFASEVIVGAKPGYYNEGISNLQEGANFDIALRPVTIGNNLNYNFVTPGLCQVCHPNQVNSWSNSNMGKAGMNMWMHDIYNGDGTPGGQGGFVYTRDSVNAGTNPDSVCASCHQPEGYVKGNFSGRVESPSDLTYPGPAATHGVSCETCHKIADVDINKMNFPGVQAESVTFNLPEAGHQVQYGLLPDVNFAFPGFMEPSFQPQLVAEICGTCHQDQVDVHQDRSFSGIVSEPTFMEWKESPWGDPNSGTYKTCIDCHMPSAGINQICENETIPRDPATIRDHNIEGTTPQYLENAVEMSMTTGVASGQLMVTVNINNSLSGHHVPTGVSIRNMILLVEAWIDGQDPLSNPLSHTGTQTIHAVGGVGNPAQGYYAGLPGKVYAKVNHDASMQGPVFFTEAVGTIFDTRIPTLTTDTTNYSFTMPASGTGTVKVRARLIYRRAFRSLVDAKNWTTDGHGRPLADIAAPHYGHLMEQSTADVPFSN